MTIMCFQRIYEDILKKVLQNAENLHNKDLIEYIHKASKGVKFDWVCDYEKCRETCTINETLERTVTLEEAIKEKDAGTKHFRSNELNEALDSYTKYLELCHAIQDDGNLVKTQMLYQGYANRSIVLFRGQKVSTLFLQIYF